jgi:bifunctional non-homologous end joining protein LigD
VVSIWDHGTYTLEKQTPHELRFVLHGARLRGAYALIRMERRPRDWLLMRLAGG